MSSLEAVVQALRRSDTRSRALPYLIHAALGATIWVTAVLLAARVVPVETRFQLAELGIPVMLAAVGIAWIAQRPRPHVLMQLADLRLGLQERLSTAWERRAERGVMDDLLRQDALQHAQRDRLTQAFPLRINRKEAGVLAILAAAALTLAVLPNPMDQVLAQRQADRASQAKAASAISAVQKKIAASPKAAPVDPKVLKILSDAQQKITQAQDPRQALQAISPAEQQLQQLSDPQTPARTSTAQNLANALSATAAGNAAGQALNSSPSSGAQALRDLASQLQSLSPQERAQLANALAGAAQHAQDPAMAASLQSASAALSNGDVAAAAGALTDLAGQLDSLQGQQSNDQAAAQLASAKQQLAAARSSLAATLASTTPQTIQIDAAQVQIEQVNVNTLKHQVAGAVIASPIDGIVSQVNIKAGQSVTGGGTAVCAELIAELTTDVTVVDSSEVIVPTVTVWVGGLVLLSVAEPPAHPFDQCRQVVAVVESLNRSSRRLRSLHM